MNNESEYRAINTRLRRLEELLCIFIGKEKQIMSAIDDLKKGLADVSASFAKLSADVLLAVEKLKVPGISASDVQAVAASLETTAASIDEMSTSLESALNPPAPVA